MHDSKFWGDVVARFVKRLLVSTVASALITVGIAALRYLALFPGGIKFDGPEEFFAFLGFLLLLFPTGMVVIFVMLSFMARGK